MTLCLPAFAAQQIKQFVHDDEQILLAEYCCEAELVRGPTGQVRLKGEVEDETKQAQLVQLLAPAWVVTDSQSVFVIVICGPQTEVALARTESHEV